MVSCKQISLLLIFSIEVVCKITWDGGGGRGDGEKCPADWSVCDQSLLVSN